MPRITVKQVQHTSSAHIAELLMLLEVYRTNYYRLVQEKQNMQKEKQQLQQQIETLTSENQALKTQMQDTSTFTSSEHEEFAPKDLWKFLDGCDEFKSPGTMTDGQFGEMMNVFDMQWACRTNT